jgi:hypothetical protein
VKHKVAALFLALVGTLPLAAQGRIPAASSVMPPGYIQQMPTVERVLSDMKVADSVDSRARQYAAVSYLWEILIDLTSDHRFVRTSDNKVRSGLTPEESSLDRGYLDAQNRLNSGSAGIPGLTSLINRYSAASGPFHKELLDRYFSAAWKAGLLAFEGRLKAEKVASKRVEDSVARADSVASEEEARPFRPAPVPPGERRFAVALTNWCRAWPGEQGNPLAVEEANRKFMLRLDPIVHSVGPIKDWSGILLALTPGLNGASVTITVDTVSSYSGGSGDAHREAAAIVGAWFASGTPAYADASRLRVDRHGQRVTFSGRALVAGREQFFSNDEGEGCRIRLGMELTAIQPAP